MENEIYKIKTQSNQFVPVEEHFTEMVLKHLEYGEEAVRKMRSSIRKTFIVTHDQINDKTKNNNSLLVGKVQSGKTSNLELFTGLAFDNGFNVVVIFGGYDKKLLKQTCDRFKEVFEIDDEDDTRKSPELFSTDNDKKRVLGLDENTVKTILKIGKPIIFVSMKRPNALSKITRALSVFPRDKINAFIIDDEGDQASLNTEYKQRGSSSTYSEIVMMKKLLNDPLYLSVTATPQANVLLGEFSELRPDSLRLIQPGQGYTGLEYFHTGNTKVKLIDQTDVDKLANDKVPDSLMMALYHFIISSAIMKDRNINKSDMIIHTARENVSHSEIYNAIIQRITSIQESIKYNQTDDLDFYINKRIFTVFNKNYFDEEIINSYSFEHLKPLIVDVLSNTHVIQQDSTGGITQENLKYKPHKIYIGGDLLQRGLTFKHLVTTYFTRWPKNGGNMDTTTQRARWLGYRGEFIDLCRVFTTFKISMQYSALAEVENDLWEQFSQIENNQLQINDIIVSPNGSELRPTRQNVADYSSVEFTKRWINQRYGISDEIINRKNTRTVDKVLEKYSFERTCVGRVKQDKTTAFYSDISREDFETIIKNTESIFATEPFERKMILSCLDEKRIVIEKMFGVRIDTLTESKDVRERSFDPNTWHISALQQGANTTDVEKLEYLGDSSVIVDENAVVLQIFRVLPKIGEEEIHRHDLVQYMFSLHVPEKRKGFVKND